MEVLHELFILHRIYFNQFISIINKKRDIITFLLIFNYSQDPQDTYVQKCRSGFEKII